MTSYNKNSLISRNRGGKGGVTLNKRVLLNKRAVLGGGLIFLGF